VSGLDITRRTVELEGVAPDAIPYDRLMQEQTPVILKGVARDWPLVRKGQESPDAAMQHIESFYNGRPIVEYRCGPEAGGRYFYTDAVDGFNFERGRVPLQEFFARIREMMAHPDGSSAYVGSTDLDGFFPGLRGANDLVLNHSMFEAHRPLVSLWMGNHTIASAHYDMSHNLACCMVGKRTFTLFPPEQVANLYPGPLEPTPGGQVVSMVDFRAPDLDRYPRFAEAMAAGQVAELEPGDVLFYPALWWHNVEGVGAFTAMINYWWNTSPAFMDTPQNTLLHAMLSLRDRPAPEKQAWKALFDYYIFGPADAPAAHLPEGAQGNLAPLDAASARRLRAMLLNRLNR
jgi:hypothetical protein